MPKLLHVLAAFFIISFGFSQSKVNLKGIIIDENSKLPIESATVYLTSVKDSSVVDYTISDRTGKFTFSIKKIDYPINLKVSYITFQDYKIENKNLNDDKDFGVISLKEAIVNLNEVVIKSEAPPIRIKKDTLEFNVSSFKVRPDANVETLLKQLPGVEIDSDGKITVNGKEVNQILVNGKPFFDKDGKIALQNLPSNIINKVQVTDTKTKKEEKTGAVASSNNASINLTNTDITKVKFTLKKTADNTTVNSTIVVGSGTVSSTFNGLTASTNYYFTIEFYATVNNIEVLSSNAGYIGTVFSPYPFTTATPNVCIPLTSITVTSIEVI